MVIFAGLVNESNGYLFRLIRFATDIDVGTPAPLSVSDTTDRNPERWCDTYARSLVDLIATPRGPSKSGMKSPFESRSARVFPAGMKFRSASYFSVATTESVAGSIAESDCERKFVT